MMGMSAERAIELDATRVALELFARGDMPWEYDVGELAWMELGECLWWDDPWVAVWVAEFEHALSVFENGEGE